MCSSTSMYVVEVQGSFAKHQRHPRRVQPGSWHLKPAPAGHVPLRRRVGATWRGHRAEFVPAGLVDELDIWVVG
jgi:hypothetical protein